MDKYVVQNGDGDEDDFATLPEAITCADEILAEYRKEAIGGEWPDCAEHVRVLEVLAIAKPTYGADDDGEEFVDYIMDEASECDPEISRLAGLVAAATKRADDAEKQRDAAVKVLRDAEWNSYDGPGVCKLCRQTKTVGHAPSCALAACLNGCA